MYRKVVLVAAIALGSASAQAALFDVTLSWTNGAGSAPYNFSFNDAEEAIDVVDLDFIKKQWGNFGATQADTALAEIKFRGVPIQVHYTTDPSGQESFRLKIDALNIDKNFSGEDALDDLKDYLVEKGEHEILTQINKAAVEKTSFDPVAGNPSSLMSTMVDNIYFLTNSSITGTNRQDIDNQWDLGLRYSSYTTADNQDVINYNLPLAYTFKLDWFPGHRLQFRMPMNYTTINEDAKSYSLQLGFAWTIPLIEGLEITPAIDYGAAGSAEILTVGVLRALSLTTRYDFSLLGQNFTLNNSLVKIDSERIEYEDDDDEDPVTYAIDYDLSNKAMTNGLAWHIALPWQLATQVFVRDTRYSGDALYSDQVTEYGVNFGWSGSAATNTQFFVGASYQSHAKEEFDGARMNIGLTF
ncbi:hypothetical protein [Pseudomonas sp.]|uniref:hypothetical protein n=1 Tax=Pseudomonas sp. TaxID=306 RepID=UPI0019DAAD8A|nr:hypothetical protein [Pseudomonas sp.]MBF0676458.1 hypothetical protein [Pseudomonas sp.]